MMEKSNLLSILWKGFGLLAIISVILSGIVAGQVTVDGNFEGTMVGYGEDANAAAGDAPNEITVEGSFTVGGEPMEDVDISVTSAEYTVLDTSSVELRVPGEGIEFTTNIGPDQVVKSTEQLPEGTEVELMFSVYYIGDSSDSISDNSINAGTINIDYMTLGGSSGDQSFSAQTDVSNRAESEIASAQQGSQISTLQKYLSYIGGAALVILVLYLLVYLVGQIGGNGKPKKPN